MCFPLVLSWSRSLTANAECRSVWRRTYYFFLWNFFQFGICNCHACSLIFVALMYSMRLNSNLKFNCVSLWRFNVNLYISRWMKYEKFLKNGRIHVELKLDGCYFPLFMKILFVLSCFGFRLFFFFVLKVDFIVFASSESWPCPRKVIYSRSVSHYPEMLFHAWLKELKRVSFYTYLRVIKSLRMVNNWCMWHTDFDLPDLVEIVIKSLNACICSILLDCNTVSIHQGTSLNLSNTRAISCCFTFTLWFFCHVSISSISNRWKVILCRLAVYYDNCWNKLADVSNHNLICPTRILP